MTIEVGAFTFAGPFESPEELQDKAGLWAVHDWVNKRYYLLDLGEGPSVRAAVSGHPGRGEWETGARGTLFFSAFYKPDSSPQTRAALLAEVRASLPPQAGSR